MAALSPAPQTKATILRTGLERRCVRLLHGRKLESCEGFFSGLYQSLYNFQHAESNWEPEEGASFALLDRIAKP
jgi:hypothetical protein